MPTTDVLPDSPDELLEAASLMRHNAERATPGPWRGESSGPTGPVVMDAESHNALDHVAQCKHYRARSDAEHIASWHPDVAIAAAAWLEQVASTWGTPGHRPWHAAERAALTFARTYLGRTS